MIKKIIFITCGAIILMSSKCAQTKVLLQDSPEIRITDAYIQKIVPGKQNQKPYIEFGFKINGLTKGLTIDSVFCEVGKSVDIKTDGLNKLQLLIKAQLIDNYKYDKAIFYYSQKDSKYQIVLNNIIKRETLFLP